MRTIIGLMIAALLFWVIPVKFVIIVGILVIGDYVACAIIAAFGSQLEAAKNAVRSKLRASR